MISPLISAAELYSSLTSAKPPVILDVRWRLGGAPGLPSFVAGHIPGAVFVDFERAMSAPPGIGGRHPLPSASDFEAAMRAAGVSASSLVVAYDDGDGLPAARTWWNLRYFGHDHVQVLDGGFRAWQAAALPETAPGTDPAASAASPAASASASTAGAAASAARGAASAARGAASAARGAASAARGVGPVPGDFTARPGGMPLLDADGAAALARSGVLLDVRAAERYRGETEPIDPVAGHIPGALNFPIALIANPDGTYRSGPEIATALASAAPSGPSALPAPVATAVQVATGVYCGSGITAARGVLALELAGVHTALYAGSWSNWIADPTRPIATSER